VKDQLLAIAFISIGVGIGLAVLLLILVRLRRLNQQVNSLVERNDLIGLTGIVQIPFDKNSKGKVRVNLQGNLLDLTAITESDDAFEVGEAVIILQSKENKVLVISEKYLRSDS
jgi:membrane protein implicated in regulation of membrane protease activity